MLGPSPHPLNLTARIQVDGKPIENEKNPPPMPPAFMKVSPLPKPPTHALPAPTPPPYQGRESSSSSEDGPPRPPSSRPHKPSPLSAPTCTARKAAAGRTPKSAAAAARAPDPDPKSHNSSKQGPTSQVGKASPAPGLMGGSIANRLAAATRGTRTPASGRLGATPPAAALPSAAAQQDAAENTCLVAASPPVAEPLQHLQAPQPAQQPQPSQPLQPLASRSAGPPPRVGDAWSTPSFAVSTDVTAQMLQQCLFADVG